MIENSLILLYRLPFLTFILKMYTRQKKRKEKKSRRARENSHRTRENLKEKKRRAAIIHIPYNLNT
jgi:hypothetical protein